MLSSPPVAATTRKKKPPQMSVSTRRLERQPFWAPMAAPIPIPSAIAQSDKTMTVTWIAKGGEL